VVRKPSITRISSSHLADFPDNGMLTEANAGIGTSLARGPGPVAARTCLRRWPRSHAPADTESFAIIMDDPDAAMGRGGNHWIMFDIPASARKAWRAATRTSRASSSAATPATTWPTWGMRGAGAKAHHFIFMLYALDIGLGKLKPGLTRAKFMQQVQDHRLAEASIMGRYPARRDGKAMLSAKWAEADSGSKRRP